MRKKLVLEKTYREYILLGLILGKYNQRSLLHDRHSLSFNLKRDINKLKPGDLIIYWWDVTNTHLRILDDWDIKYLKLDHKLYGNYLRGSEIRQIEREELRKSKTIWWSLINLGHATYADIYREILNQKKIYSITMFDIVKNVDLTKKDIWGKPIHKLEDKTESLILKTNKLYFENIEILNKLKIGTKSYEEAFVNEYYRRDGDFEEYKNELNLVLAKIKSHKTHIDVHNYIAEKTIIKKFKRYEDAKLYLYKELIKKGYYPNFHHKFHNGSRSAIGYYF